MTHKPLTLSQANAFVAEHHRHNRPVVGHRFSIGAFDVDRLVGVAIVGRPIARKTEQYECAEILRVCVLPDAPRNTNSYLYGACRRIWQALGGGDIITFTLQSESGASLRGAGYVEVVKLQHKNSWDSKSRPRKPGTVDAVPKIKWSGSTRPATKEGEK